MQNKKTIMAFSALFILIFHLWINVTNSQIEMYLRQICVIGVDLFFFVSAYSITKRKNIEYKKFIIDRFCKIYLKFIIFAIIAALYLNWDLTKFIKTILGLELFNKGGGSFLWFIPGIMLVYLTLPLYKRVDEKYPKATPILATIIFLLISITISSLTNYRNLFILTNRIPIILLGYYFSKYDIFKYLNRKNLIYWLVTIILIISGIVISYLVYINHFNVTWFREIFYILYIPLNIGVILLLDKIKDNKISSLIGSVTLELYALQMIFGFKIANEIFKYTNMRLLSNILITIVLLILAIILKKIFDLPYKFKAKKKI